MIGKLQKAAELISNMGWRYIIFRTGFEFQKRNGSLKKKFPLDPPHTAHYTLESWRKTAAPFFFESREQLNIPGLAGDALTATFENITQNKYTFFSGIEYDLGNEPDWITNPDTGFKYDADAHWLDINDYSQTAGDIKFVWERSRFSHIYTYIRYDQHTGKDQSKRVFDEIADWIDKNKINRGPNFKCSQEISLRILNWTFALYYYKNSENLTPELFDKIQHYIYWQTHHDYNNINFSRIAVRNNHAITETLLLYVVGTLFPAFPDAAKWKKDGKRWFEQEVAYQVYEDGTFLQFSMNYHRVLIQLLTWGIRLADVNNDRFADVVYDRAKKSLVFLTACMNETDGWLPNYGANDGALFFKLSDNHYRDYRPQLEALSHVLGLKFKHGGFEDTFWYGCQPVTSGEEIGIASGYKAFTKSGYYIFRQDDSLTFIRCGNHKDRPSQADNLHLDVWYKGKNILHDAGSYKYNTDTQTLRYFMGTQSHNTIMLGNADQMEKGARFIWYKWSQCKAVNVSETDEAFVFEGTISAFGHIKGGITHTRKVIIQKLSPVWHVKDTIDGKPEVLVMKQLWHTRYANTLAITATDQNDKTITPAKADGYVSDFYGKKEVCDELTFVTSNSLIKTTIKAI